MSKTTHSRPEQDDNLALRLTRALENPPKVDIPEGFAARIAAQAVPRTSPAIQISQIGRTFALIAAALLLLVLAVLAPAALPISTFSLAVEFALAGEFVLLICYVTLTRPGRR